MNTAINFIPLSKKHFPLLLQWLNEPHVRQWYNTNETVTLDAIEQKMTPRIAGEVPIHGYIIFFQETPIGYIQVYDARKFPREGYELASIEHGINHIPKLAALDLYIGNSAFMGKGYGTAILKQFLSDIVMPHYDACLADPDIQNKTSVRAFEKAGFVLIDTLTLANRKSAAILLYEKSEKGKE